MAIAIDVTFAKGPGANDHRTFPLGKGVALGWGPNIHPAIHTRFKELAEQLDIPYHFDPCRPIPVPMQWAHKLPPKAFPPWY
jgi:tetrahedral aminopeptidase